MLEYFKLLIFLVNPVKSVLAVKDGTSFNHIHFNRKHDRCLILGNGPSLKDDKIEIDQKRYASDMLCVNHLPSTDLFFTYKPEYYTITDIGWWVKNVNEDEGVRRELVFKKLHEVDWPLQLFLSANADLDFIRSKISNENISLIKAKSTGLFRPFDYRAFRLYDTGYFTPPIVNVLIFAVFCAIKAGYREIEIYGADLSYIFLVDVDQKSNSLFIKSEHFYASGEKEIMKETAKADSAGLTMSTFLQYQAWTLMGHEQLSEYARSKKIRIINRSTYSIIDAYDRPGTEIFTENLK